jgi:hypothetical protein
MDTWTPTAVGDLVIRIGLPGVVVVGLLCCAYQFFKNPPWKKN